MQPLFWDCENESVCCCGGQFQNLIQVNSSGPAAQAESNSAGIWRCLAAKWQSSLQGTQTDAEGWFRLRCEDENTMLTKSTDTDSWIDDLSLFRAFRAGVVITGISGIKDFIQAPEVQHHSVCRARALSGFKWWTRIGFHLRIACNTACI